MSLLSIFTLLVVGMSIGFPIGAAVTLVWTMNFIEANYQVKVSSDE